MAPDAPTPDPSPHSRACGWRAHPHGPECSTNCPTCHGGPMPDPSPDTPSEQHTESNKENTTMDNTPNTISIDGTDNTVAVAVIPVAVIPHLHSFVAAVQQVA